MTPSEEFGAAIGSLTENDFIAGTINPLNELKNSAATQMKCKMELFVMSLQTKILRHLETYEPIKKFKTDRWERGVSCVLQDGDVFEKAGVNISVINGNLNSEHFKSFKSRGKHVSEDYKKFFATGISSIIHPRNPFVPSIHFNYRYFECMDENGVAGQWWFGGGCDLTPVYINEKDTVHFHKIQKAACDKHNTEYYPKFKKQADDYFYIKHRGEHRGVGGTLFGSLEMESKDKCFDVISTLANAVIPSYLPIVNEHRNDEFEEKHVIWQQLRRGRYIEFNLVYDAGTKFGLITPGVRLESILMSLPLNARWEYMNETKPGSEEEKTLELLKNKPKDWA